MVKFRMKTKIMAVVTFFVISAAVILGGYDMQNAEATGGTMYVKYDFTTGQSQTYILPEIQTVNYANYAMRSVVTDTREPYYDSAVVSLKLFDAFLDNPNASYLYQGTGFIIGEHEIMTAAHLIYGNDYNCSHIDSAKAVIPDSSTYTDNALTLNIVSAHVPKTYINSINNMNGENARYYDYAIMTVQEDLSSYGCYLLGMGTDSIKQKNVPIHSLGYAGRNLKISHGTIDVVQESSYKFNLFSLPGSSGGPIYVESSFGVPGTSNEEYQIKTYRTAISIVSGGNGTANPNPYGTRIRPVIMQFAYDNEYL